MPRTNSVRRAARLLGAVTVTGVLSTGVLAATPAAAETRHPHAVSSSAYAKVTAKAKHGQQLHWFIASGLTIRTWGNGL